MGLPLTWVTLSLVQLFWVDWSRSYTINPQPTAICGDDLVGLWNARTIRNYERIVNACGGQFSKGKHFVHPHRGVFTEECFTISGRTTTVVRGTRRVPFVSLDGSVALLPVPGVPRNRVRRCACSVKFIDRAVPLRGLLDKPTNFPGSSEFVPWWVALGPGTS